MGEMADGRAGPISAPFAGLTSLRRSPKRLASIALAVVLVSSFGIYLFFSRSPHITNPPQSIAISVCPNVTSGVHRISSDFGIRFDAPENAFSVHAGLRDMPAGMLYVVKLKDADANIVVWRDDDIFRDLKIAYPVFSEHVEERSIRGAKGRIFGTDRWGYLQSGERWRYVKFSTGDAVGYEPTSPKQADLLDQVVNSACFSRDEIPRK
ncbi:MAG: hypothetical protein ACHQT6_10250 [Candidatus Acidiferrales bacterium]